MQTPLTRFLFPSFESIFSFITVSVASSFSKDAVNDEQVLKKVSSIVKILNAPSRFIPSHKMAPRNENSKASIVDF